MAITILHLLVVQTHIEVLIDDGFEVEPSKRVSQINHYSCQAIGQAEIHLKLLLLAYEINLM